MKLQAILLLVAASTSIGACSTINKVSDAANTPVNTAALSQRVYEAKILYGASLTPATLYLQRPRCTVPNPPVLCSEPHVRDIMVQYRIAAGSATLAAENGVRSLSANPTLTEALVKGAESTTAAFSSMTKAYGEIK